MWRCTQNPVLRKSPGNRISWSISKGLGLCNTISHTGLDYNENTQNKVTIRINLKIAKAHWKLLYKSEMIANCKLLHWNEQLIVPAQLPLQLIWSHINVICIKFWYQWYHWKLNKMICKAQAIYCRIMSPKHFFLETLAFCSPRVGLHILIRERIQKVWFITNFSVCLDLLPQGGWACGRRTP